eukprot:8772417-Alexandrium_andersonii.AAC.1
MFEPVPYAEQLLEFRPPYANPRELPHGLDHRIFVPTLDPYVDRQRMRHISGPDQIARGYEYPSDFEFNWLRPAPLAKET